MYSMLQQRHELQLLQESQKEISSNKNNLNMHTITITSWSKDLYCIYKNDHQFLLRAKKYYIIIIIKSTSIFSIVKFTWWYA